MVTSIVSALIKKPVNRNLAMTGEITLRGRILPIGGLKEKILAAHRGGISEVIIPDENSKDLKEIPAKILKQIEVITASHMDDVLSRAIVLQDGETLFKEEPEEIVPPELLPKPEEAVEPFQIN
jgi:ATP-dependent Lon protease